MRGQHLRLARGSAVILALVTIVFAAVIVTTVGRQAAMGRNMAARERQLSQAYYAAESALLDFLHRPELYVPTLPLKHSAEDDFTTARTPLPGNPELSYQLSVAWLHGKVYEVKSMGHTPHASALAGAEIMLQGLQSDTLDTAFHMGGLGVPLTVPGTPGGGAGTPNSVNYHFTGSDMAVYGILDFERDAQGEPLQSEQTFNIWPDYKFLTWNHTVTPEPVMPVWLDDKHGDLPAGSDFPAFIADAIRIRLVTTLPTDGYGAPDRLTQTKMEVGSGWATGSPTAGRVQYAGTISNNTDLEGLGVLYLDTTAPARFATLTLHGDLTIVAKGDISISYISNGQTTQTHDTGGHKLNIVSDGTIRIGPSSSTYDPYPYFAQSRNDRFFLGSGSVLWAQKGLEIGGQIRAGRPSDYPELVAVDFDPKDDAMRIIIWDDDLGTIQGSLDPVGSLYLVSRGTGVSDSHSLTLHTFDSAGIVYAGDRIKAFRVRLHGWGFVYNPYQIRKKQGRDVVGLAELNMTSGGELDLEDFELPDLYATMVRRLQ